MLLIAGAVEIYAERHTAGALSLALVLGVAGVSCGALGWERYRRIMVLADYLGDHATCEQCRAYGRFEVTEAGSAMHLEPVDIRNPEEVWLRVHCKKCGNEWRM